MGYSRWDASSWHGHSAGLAGLRREEVFGRRSLHRAFDPRFAGIRESRDSALNAESNAVIVALNR